MTLRVLLADDQRLIRAGFRVLVECSADMDVVGEASDGRAAVAMAKDLLPDVILMDIRMPQLDGIEATRLISADPELSDVHVLILTTFETDDYIVEALRAGASGFLLKDAEPTELLEAIRIVASGDALLAPSVTRRLICAFVEGREGAPGPAESHELEQLTDREREVLHLIATGLNNTEIADALFISVATAKTHVSRIMSKMSARDRAQLVILAYESGLVLPGS